MRFTPIAVAGCLSMIACAENGSDTANDTPAAGPESSATAATSPGGDTGTRTTTSARATVSDSSGRELGTLMLADTVGGIALAGRLQGLPPGQHAIHLHMTGLCAPPFESAGGHWNPTNRQHGLENPAGPHFGDMPNLSVGTDSAVTVQTITPGGSIRGPSGLLDADGAAVVVHAQPDDNRSDPAGNAGDRIACGAVSDS